MTFNLTTGQMHLAIVINSLGQALKVEEAVSSEGAQLWNNQIRIPSYQLSSANLTTQSIEPHCQIVIFLCTLRRRLARSWLFK